MPPTEHLTPETFRADLAEHLHQAPEEVDLTENPLDAGLDSLRITALAERWRSLGADVTFVDLAERATFADWWQLLTERRKEDTGAVT